MSRRETLDLVSNLKNSLASPLSSKVCTNCAAFVRYLVCFVLMRRCILFCICFIVLFIVFPQGSPSVLYGVSPRARVLVNNAVNRKQGI